MCNGGTVLFTNHEGRLNHSTTTNGHMVTAVTM